MTGLSNGLWISISLSGFFVPPGYYHYTTLTIESLKEKNCDIGTFAFEFGKILNEQVGKESMNECARVYECIFKVERTLIEPKVKSM